MTFENSSSTNERTAHTTVVCLVPSKESRNRRDVPSLRRNFVWPELPVALHESQPWGRAGIEPPLREVLADPLIHAIMRCDGVSNAALESVIIRARWRMRQGSEGARHIDTADVGAGHGADQAQRCASE